MSSRAFKDISELEEYTEDDLEYQAENGIFTVGDDIIDSFYSGNYSSAIRAMRRHGIHPKEFMEYVDHVVSEQNWESIDKYFDRCTCAEIGYSFYRME